MSPSSNAAALLALEARVNAIAVKRKRREADGGDGTRVQTAIVVSLFALMSLEGAHPGLSFDRDHEVSVTKVVTASTEDVEARLAGPPSLGRSTPLFFRLGFPEPMGAGPS